MRIPLSWLAEFVTWSRPAAALAERLTMAGVKIEAIEEVGRLDPRIVAGRRAAGAAPPPAPRPRAGRGRRAGDAARAAPRHRRHRARGRGDAEPRRLPLDPRRGARGGGRDGRSLAPPAPPPARIGRRRRARGAGARGGGRPLPALLRARRA